MLAACTSSGSSGARVSSAHTRTATPSQNGVPVDGGPTRAVTAPSCPFVASHFVHYTMGMRLGRLTVLRSGGRTVGCRFYALQGSFANEHLPGPRQPVVEITTRQFVTTTGAHNAFVSLGTASKTVERADLGRTTGVCFQADFYPKDHGADWACAASVGRTEVVVRTVDTTSSLNTATVTRAVLRRV